jgi:hypothetical protein
MNLAVFIEYLRQCLVPTLRPGVIVIIVNLPGDKRVQETDRSRRRNLIIRAFASSRFADRLLCPRVNLSKRLISIQIFEFS